MISKSTIDDYNRRKLENLIKEVSDLHGGDDAVFLDDYIAEVLKEWSNDLVAAIACFEDLKRQAKFAQPYRAPDKKIVQPVKGHGAFREHYEQLERNKALGERN